jgi:beta-galactosidase
MAMRNMRKRDLTGPGLFVLLAAVMLSCNNHKSTENTRSVLDWNSGWKFIKDTASDDFYSPGYADRLWESVTLPHTPNIEPLVVNDQWRGIAWYRKKFKISEDLSGKNVYLKFEGAMQVADVWINGNRRITHYGGYLPFFIDITGDLISDSNIVAIRLNNEENLKVPPGKPLETLDFNTYGGLYRNVSMIITDRLHITDPAETQRTGGGGIKVEIDSITATHAFLSITTHIQNNREKDSEIRLVHSLINKNGEEAAKVVSPDTLIMAGKETEYYLKLKVKNPELWHPENPVLYTLHTILSDDKKEIDVIDEKIGIRKIELKADGFYINSNKFFIRGTNRHQEYPYIGYALSDEAQYRDAVKIKSAGFDFVRLSHYPQSQSFLDACDELGLLVMNCIPGWQYMGDSVFRKNSLDDCRNMIRRDRNHASVVFWEVSLNETQMDTAYMEEANRILDEELSGKALSAGWVDYKAYDLFIPARQHASPPDYWNNYRTGERPVFIAEYGDWEYYAQNAGFNQTDYNGLKPEERNSRQFRSDGEKRLLQQALNYQESSNSNLKGRSTIGHANWLMFDYNRGYADDIEASGIADIFRIPKFSFYFFQSQRTPMKLTSDNVQSGPMVYIASWWQPWSSQRIRVFSNCEEVALYLNNELIEKRTHDTDAFSSQLNYPPFTFSMESYREGTLKAIGYVNGKQVAEHLVRSPQEPVALAVEYDLSGIPLNTSGKDYIFVYAKVIDRNGTVCPVNGLPVEFSISSNARLIGENPAAVQAGIASIVLQTMPGSGEVRVSAKTDELKSGELVIR